MSLSPSFFIPELFMGQRKIKYSLKKINYGLKIKEKKIFGELLERKAEILIRNTFNEYNKVWRFGSKTYKNM